MTNISFSHSFVGEAVKEAKKATCVSKKMRLGCIIFSGKSILARGHNHSNMEKGIPNRYLKWRGSLHAEMSAIFSAFEKRKNLQGASLLVIRLNRNDQFRLAKPCGYCSLAIKEITPIKKIWYSVEGYPYIKGERVIR